MLRTFILAAILVTGLWGEAGAIEPYWTPRHVVLELGPDVEQWEGKWFAGTRKSTVLFARLVQNPPDIFGESVFKVTEVIRGEVKVGDVLRFRRATYGLLKGELTLIIGVARPESTSDETRYIPFDERVLVDVRAVVNKAMAIQASIPRDQERRRQLVLIDQLKTSTTGRARAWLEVFPDWFMGIQLWQIDQSPELTRRLRSVLDLELAPDAMPDADITPGRQVLELMSQAGAPPLPLSILVACLKRKESMRDSAAALLTRTEGPDRDKAINAMRAVLRDERHAYFLPAVLKSLGEMKARSALPELRAALKNTDVTWEARNAIHAINPHEAEASLWAEVRDVRVVGSGYFPELAKISAGRYKNPQLVPYLVEALHGMDRVILFNDHDGKGIVK
jgi:hypothetical protein